MSITRDIIMADLDEHGPSTSHQIAQRTGLRPLQISNTLTWARGEGLVNDGSTIYDWPGSESEPMMSCSHRPKGPVAWHVGDTPTVKGRCPEQFPEDYKVAVRDRGSEVRLRHNHFTSDIKAPGVCPACDAHRTFAEAVNAETVSETEYVEGVD